MQVPLKGKVEKVASKTSDRPVLSHIYLRVDRAAEEGMPGSGRGTLEATDSYKLVRVPVALDPSDEEGFVTAEALQTARKTNRHDPRISTNGSLEVKDGPTLPRPGPELGTFPNTERLIPEFGPAGPAFSFGVNARLLYELAQGLGSDAIRLEFQHGGDFDPMPNALRPIYVRPLSGGEEGADGIIMPIRLAG